mmetsp:Transcript_21605/g.30265  ORF Transcript_21605/g.30265 Transcript_21605/m.30265 type:complete len:211 (-) Transcript_21605:398-1030(-)
MALQPAESATLLPLANAPSLSRKGTQKALLAALLAVFSIVAVAFAFSQSSTPTPLAAYPAMTTRGLLKCPAACSRGLGRINPFKMPSSTRRLSLRGGAMTEIAKGVSFDTVAREWRMKWSGDEDKQSLVAAQEALNDVLSEVKAVPGVKSVQRVVCGGCLDFKVITSLEGDKFGEWESSGFKPEEKFIEKVKAIPGISFVETQTYTLMPM